MLGRLTTTGMQVAVLALAAWAAWSGPLQAPLFNSDARVAPPPQSPDSDDWRFGDLRALSVPKLYYLGAANAWLDAGEATEVEAERLAASDVAAINARTMLSYSPTNGYGWISLAWSALQRGGEKEGKALLALSRAWSPHSRDMALIRVMLNMRWWPEMDLTQREALLDELALVRRGVARPALLAMVERSPRLAALWTLTRGRLRAKRDAARMNAQ